MRGLKPKNEHGYETLRKSHLLQMRGLKRETDAKVNLSEVASFTDAWIETFLEVSALIFLVSHLLQMRGLKQQKE